MSLALYGHPFSSYTQKVLIALFENDIPFEFRCISRTIRRMSQTGCSSGPCGGSPCWSTATGT